MSQDFNSPTTAPASSPSVDQPKIANNDDALRTNFSGSTPPTTSVAGQLYFNTEENIMYCRNKDNTIWEVAINNNGGTTQLLDGTLSKLNHGTTVKVGLGGNGTQTIMLPTENSVNLNYIVDMIGDGTSIKIDSQNGESFYRGTTVVSSFTFVGSPNTIMKICRFSDGKFIVGGEEQGANINFSNITPYAYKVMLDLILPIGSSVVGKGTGFIPPMQDFFGVHWEIEPEGYVPISSTLANSGAMSGNNRLDIGATDEYQLSKENINHYNALGDTFSVLGSTVSSTGLVKNWVSTAKNWFTMTTDKVTNNQTMSSGNQTTGEVVEMDNTSFSMKLNVKTSTRATYWRVS